MLTLECDTVEQARELAAQGHTVKCQGVTYCPPRKAKGLEKAHMRIRGASATHDRARRSPSAAGKGWRGGSNYGRRTGISRALTQDSPVRK